MVVQMFRASFRSLADPLRGHVCVPCRVNRISAPVSRLRQFHRMPVLRDEHSDNKPESHVNDTPKIEAEKSTEKSAEKPTEKPDEAQVSKKKQNQASTVKKKTPSTSPKTKNPSPRKSKGQKTKKPEGPAKKTQPKSTPKSQETVDSPEATKEAETQKTEPKKVPGKTKGRSPRTLSKINDLLAAANKESSTGGPKVAKGKSELSHISSYIRQKHTGTLEFDGLKIKPLDVPTAPVPRLSFGLDRVLFNPGVYQLRDPRSRVYNFDPYLGSIMPVTEFDFGTLKDYITSSKDTALRDIAVNENKKYVGSSSSMTSVLSHFHYLLSGWRAVDTRAISQGFPEKMRSFTRLLRSPAAMFLHYQDGVYAIDADKEFDSANILMNLGKSMEKLLTLPKEEFERYRRSSENKITAEEEEAIPESYHYSTYGDFIMRSQLDAYDPRLPGTGMFDLKTRAVVSIRMDTKNYEQGLGYEIRSRFGTYESYEREYYDMIRAAFLKYSLQVRIGRMDGIFVAFHNIERIFGFQYISLPEMDQALHGQSDTTLGNAEFQLSLDIWNEVLNKATAKYPKQSLRFHFETRDAVTPFMYVFAEPVSKEQIHAIQTRNQAQINAFQEKLLNLTPEDNASDIEAKLSPESQPESTDASDATTPEGETASSEESEVFGLAIIARSKVNDDKVERPLTLTSSDKWVVDYEMSEMAPEQARSLYKMCQTRRSKELESKAQDELQLAANAFIMELREISQKGRVHRKHQNEIDHEQGIVVFNNAAN